MRSFLKVSILAALLCNSHFAQAESDYNLEVIICRAIKTADKTPVKITVLGNQEDDNGAAVLTSTEASGLEVVLGKFSYNNNPGYIKFEGRSKSTRITIEVYDVGNRRAHIKYESTNPFNHNQWETDYDGKASCVVPQYESVGAHNLN